MLQSVVLLLVGGVAGASAGTLFFSKVEIARQADDERASLRVAPGLNGNSVESATSAASQTAASPIRTLAAMAVLVGDDPAEALAAALRSTDPLQTYRDVRHIGAAWARLDPVAALAYADNLPLELQDAYRASVAREWANLDPDGFLAYAENAGSLVELTAGLKLLVATNPSRILDLAARLPAESNKPVNSIGMEALRALLEVDPASTLADLESMPRGQQRDDLLDAAALQYARLDPEGALAWMATFESPRPTIRQHIVRGMAATDFDRAYLLVQAEDSRSLYPASLVHGTFDVPGVVANVASNLARRDSELAAAMLANVLSLWVEEDPHGAADWLLSNQADVSASVAGDVAGRIARLDLDRVLGDLGRLSQPWRDAWIPKLAGAYARQDARAAIDWLAQFQGEPVYESAFNQLVMNASASDPRAAAEFVQNADPALQAASARDIGHAYASVDPSGAAQWALGLQSQTAISAAAAGVAYGWALEDPSSAQSWVLGLPTGDARDAAVALLMLRSDVFDIDPTRFLDEFSSDDARSDGIRSAVSMLSIRDPARAQQLLEAIADDPELGEWAAQTLPGSP